MAPDEPEVLAAGGLVWRRTDAGELEVLLVHRPRYDDWSFPKGKCDPGETLAETAHREVVEETGLAVELGPLVADVRYRDHKDRPKLVRYWAMTQVGGEFTANDEVDEMRWVTVDDARASVSYPHDRDLLDGLLSAI
jgi:8-oxo-dGTP pyrophosphatase MutT (NUDIX family)